MDIYPAIDIMKGKVVRLYMGRRELAKIYGSPLEIAAEFAEYTDTLHIVDLDGAYKGVPENLNVVREIVRELGVSVQLGGGFRSYEWIERAFEAGARYVVLGTKALDIPFIERVTQDFSGITVSLDVHRGYLAVKGWTEGTGMSAEEAYTLLRPYTDRFIYTSVDRDGTLSGVKLPGRFWNDGYFIYGGGVSTFQDIRILKERGFSGVIIGKALYEGKLHLNELKNWLEVF